MLEDGVIHYTKHDCYYNHEWHQRQVLSTQKCRRSGSDGIADLDHGGIALIGANDSPRYDGRKHEGDTSRSQGYYD